MTDHIQIIDRVFTLIEQLCQHDQPLGPTALAQMTGMSKATVYRLLNALKARGYVESSPQGAYYLGPRLVALVSSHLNSLELIAEARPYLSQLTRELNLTAHLGILDKDQVIYVEKLDALPAGQLDEQIGFRVPAYCSSLGKCLLAALSGDALEETMRQIQWRRYTANTIATPSALLQHLRQVRRQGWGMDDCEYEPDHRCIAAPVYDYRGEVIAAISASGSLVRLPDSFQPQVVRVVKAAAAALSRRLGYLE